MIKKMIPRKIFRMAQPIYHYVMGFLAVLVCGFPGRKMIVVGVTGTTGKTTVVYLTAQALRHAGLRVGYTSTAMFSDGKNDWLNDKKMTMVGRFFTQNILRRMVRNGCDVAIVETTSEGAVQFRHRFINYDVMVFTGLYPEHIDSHGSFDNYKNAKKEIFAHLAQCKHKTIKGKHIAKTIVANMDDLHAQDFMQFDVEKKIGFTQGDMQDASMQIVQYTAGISNKTGVRFACDGVDVQMHILGDFNATNAVAAISVAQALGVEKNRAIEGLMQVMSLPGRLERIDEGQDFTVIVDYAFEPVAVTKLYETIRVLEPKNIIHVLGSTGGGRDISRRAKLGRIAGELARSVIVTNEDPYDDDPLEIISAVADGARETGKVEGRNLFLITDRDRAIEKAVSIAHTGDVVLITGKGSEQAIAGKDGILFPWDDRRCVREALRKLRK
jgi:UDP-N-acetylmuramoyl-L-alanyl-D-glutamate--2,6-diaminopimelate ligase